jgi:hypothetical protein
VRPANVDAGLPPHDNCVRATLKFPLNRCCDIIPFFWFLATGGLAHRRDRASDRTLALFDCFLALEVFIDPILDFLCNIYINSLSLSSHASRVRVTLMPLPILPCLCIGAVMDFYRSQTP